MAVNLIEKTADQLLNIDGIQLSTTRAGNACGCAAKIACQAGSSGGPGQGQPMDWRVW